MDPNYNRTAVCHAPIYNLTDEINLELIKGAPELMKRVPELVKGAPAPGRDKNPLSPQPAILKNRDKKIKLQRRKSVIDLSYIDHGYNYGLSDKAPS